MGWLRRDKVTKYDEDVLINDLQATIVRLNDLLRQGHRNGLDAQLVTFRPGRDDEVVPQLSVRICRILGK